MEATRFHDSLANVVLTPLNGSPESKIEENNMGALLDTQKSLDFACYIAAHGSNDNVRIADEPLLLTVDPKEYFPHIAYPLKPSLFRRDLPKCKIGYLILAHQKWELVERLINVINFDGAIIMVYVDGKKVAFKQQVKDSIAMKGWKNVVVPDRTIEVSWGSNSMIEAQNDGFFQLQDLGNCEFYINLSAEHYPLYRGSLIYDKIMENGGVSMFKSGEYANGDHALLKTTKFWANSSIRNAQVEWVPKTAQQWMVLTNDLLTLIRKHSEAILMIAHYEWTYIPDESYYITVASRLFPGKYSEKDAPTKLSFDWNDHLSTLGDEENMFDDTFGVK